MKQTFQITIDCPAIEKYGFQPLNKNNIVGLLKCAFEDYMKKQINKNLQISAEEIK